MTGVLIRKREGTEIHRGEGSVRMEEDGGRDWSNVSIRPGAPRMTPTRSWKDGTESVLPQSPQRNQSC